MISSPPANQTLSCWKEIAAYFGKGVRTVQRWEQNLGLPIRRPSASSKIVYALANELDDWLENCWSKRSEKPALIAEWKGTPSPSLRENIAISRRLVSANASLVVGLKQSMERFSREYEQLSVKLGNNR